MASALSEAMRPALPGAEFGVIVVATACSASEVPPLLRRGFTHELAAGKCQPGLDNASRGSLEGPTPPSMCAMLQPRCTDGIRTWHAIGPGLVMVLQRLRRLGRGGGCWPVCCRPLLAWRGTSWRRLLCRLRASCLPT